MKIIGLIDPSIGSFNLGDEIVSYYCKKIIHKLFPDHFFINIPAYMECDERMKEIIEKSEHIFFLGTAPVTHEITFRWPLIMDQYMNKVILMGVGYNNWANVGMDYITRQVYLSNLSSKYKHSIRDGYSKIIIDNEVGFESINTCCPTLWNAEYIPFESSKQNSVLTTVNASRGDPVIDQNIIYLLSRMYETIFFYPQTPNDLAYFINCCDEIFKTTKKGIRYSTINPTFDRITAFMRERSRTCDYVGARLHGGIHARNLGMRSFIIGVDNRAIQIANDTGLVVLSYDFISNNPYEFMQELNMNYNWELNIPENEINEWKDQFQ